MAELEKLGPRYRVALKYFPPIMFRRHGFFNISLSFSLRVAKDPRFERLPCTHSGTYADDCLVNRVTQVSLSRCCFFFFACTPLMSTIISQHKCYIVATCDKDLKRRIRKIPGVPIMYISSRQFSIERLPEAYGGLPLFPTLII